MQKLNLDNVYHLWNKEFFEKMNWPVSNINGIEKNDHARPYFVKL